MQNKKTLKIDLDELCSAMSDSSYEHEYYLDLETGEIIFLSEHTDDEGIEEPKDKIDKEPDRYEQIPKLESHEGYEEMQDFITTVKDERFVALLKVAINGKGAFRRFKDVLLDYPEERERWFQFKGAKEQERALEWLDDIEVGLIQE
jgi:cellulose biosynthesis protein BcsQ